MRRHFCIDIDNVVAQTDAVMRLVISDFTKGRVNLSPSDIHKFEYHECRDSSGNQITPEEWGSIHDLFSEPQYLWLIRPIPGAVEGLKELAEHGTVHFATSRLSRARRVTVEWLEAYNFPPHNLHFLRHREKHASLRAFSAAVEDDYDQAVAFVQDANTPSYLLRHPWNCNGPAVEGIQWVDNWSELSRLLLRLTRAS